MTRTVLTFGVEQQAARALRVPFAPWLFGLVGLWCCTGKQASNLEEELRGSPARQSRYGVPAATDAPSRPPAATRDSERSSSSCTRGLPELPPVPADALRVTSFGAQPDDEVDDGEAIRRALDALPDGGFLVFPPGRYLHRGVVRVDRPGAVLWGFGATLHATDLHDQAIMLQADGVSLYGFVLTAVARARLEGGPECARIAVHPPEGAARVANISVRYNVIHPADRSQRTLAHGAGGAGIFLLGAHEFTVANNLVRRTLADGIHVTGGSTHGVVVGNVVANTGDDGIALVSYCPTRREYEAAGAQADARVAAALVRDVLVAGNQVRDQAWGRGLSVVGAKEVTLEQNRVHGVPFAAGILVAREDGYHTCGSQDVVVRHNEVSAIQVSGPESGASDHAYPRSRTGHAALEVHALASEEERDSGAYARTIRVGPVLLEDNIVSSAAFDGVRVGDSSGGLLVSDIQIARNRLTDLGGAPLELDRGISYRVEKNQLGDAGLPTEATAPLVDVRGARQGCDAIAPYR